MTVATVRKRIFGLPGFLRAGQSKIRAEPPIAPRAGTGLDQLPPVLAPCDWSDSGLQMMAETGAAWYFDRR